MDIDSIINIALNEDLGELGDITTNALISSINVSCANFIAKSDCVIAGLNIVERVYSKLDKGILITWNVKDGDLVKKGDIIGKIEGRTKFILIGERIALNILQRMSGIATKTYQYIQLIKSSDVKLLDTRKTIPGLRTLDKIAVKIGGGENHRFGLYDGMIIKDNHIKAHNNNLSTAINSAVNYQNKLNLNLPIIVEVENLEQIQYIFENDLNKFVSRILLDNMSEINLAKCVKYIDKRLQTEASGNVNEKNISRIAKTGVNFISCGSITHSAMAADISLRFE